MMVHIFLDQFPKYEYFAIFSIPLYKKIIMSKNISNNLLLFIETRVYSYNINLSFFQGLNQNFHRKRILCRRFPWPPRRKPASPDENAVVGSAIPTVSQNHRHNPQNKILPHRTSPLSFQWQTSSSYPASLPSEAPPPRRRKQIAASPCIF